MALDSSVLSRKALSQILVLEEPGQPSLLAEMAQTFRRSVAQYLVHLNQAVTAEDFAAVQDIAHALKGAAATLGAEHVRTVALELELSGRQRNLVGCDRRIAALEQACEQALAALAQEVQRAQPTFSSE